MQRQNEPFFTRSSGISAAMPAASSEALFVAGQLIFERDTMWNRVLHNETAFMVQKRLQHQGMPMIVVPVRLDMRAGRTMSTQKQKPQLAA